MANTRKYIVNYYGWIAGYGDWDCDDFIVRAKSKGEAVQLANERLKNTLLKGKPHVELYSTAKRKMEEALGLNVKLVTKKGNSGKIIIEYSNVDQFEMLSKLLTSKKPRSKD